MPQLSRAQRRRIAIRRDPLRPYTPPRAKAARYLRRAGGARQLGCYPYAAARGWLHKARVARRLAEIVQPLPALPELMYRDGAPCHEVCGPLSPGETPCLDCPCPHAKVVR